MNWGRPLSVVGPVSRSRRGNTGVNYWGTKLISLPYPSIFRIYTRSSPPSSSHTTPNHPHSLPINRLSQIWTRKSSTVQEIMRISGWGVWITRSEELKWWSKKTKFLKIGPWFKTVGVSGRGWGRGWGGTERKRRRTTIWVREERITQRQQMIRKNSSIKTGLFTCSGGSWIIYKVLTLQRLKKRSWPNWQDSNCSRWPTGSTIIASASTLRSSR